jgi:hypothetical protein
MPGSIDCTRRTAKEGRKVEGCPVGRTRAARFFDLAGLNKAPIAIEAVKRIDALFAIERESTPDTVAAPASAGAIGRPSRRQKMRPRAVGCPFRNRAYPPARFRTCRSFPRRIVSQGSRRRKTAVGETVRFRGQADGSLGGRPDHCSDRSSGCSPE